MPITRSWLLCLDLGRNVDCTSGALPTFPQTLGQLASVRLELICLRAASTLPFSCSNFELLLWTQPPCKWSLCSTNSLTFVFDVSAVVISSCRGDWNGNQTQVVR